MGRVGSEPTTFTLSESRPRYAYAANAPRRGLPWMGRVDDCAELIARRGMPIGSLQAGSREPPAILPPMSRVTICIPTYKRTQWLARRSSPRSARRSPTSCVEVHDDATPDDSVERVVAPLRRSAAATTSATSDNAGIVGNFTRSLLGADDGLRDPARRRRRGVSRRWSRRRSRRSTPPPARALPTRASR